MAKASWMADYICEAPPSCWICDGFILEDPTIIKVECETPGGKPCKPKDVSVHFGCYMDIDA